MRLLDRHYNYLGLDPFPYAIVGEGPLDDAHLTFGLEWTVWRAGLRASLPRLLGFTPCPAPPVKGAEGRARGGHRTPRNTGSVGRGMETVIFLLNRTEKGDLAGRGRPEIVVA